MSAAPAELTFSVGLCPNFGRRSDMRKQYYLRIRRVLEITKVILVIIWLVLIIILKLQQL